MGMFAARLARERREALAAQEAHEVQEACPMPEPKPEAAAEPKKAPVAAAKPRPATVKP
jgi:hypothetical protein